MIQLKSYFGDWRTVEKEEAQRYIKSLIDGGCCKNKIEGIHLQGISVDELLKGLTKKEPPIDVIYLRKTMLPKTEKMPDTNNREIKDCAVEIETLARKEAFYRFEQNILFSLTVWQNDENIRESMPSVTEWLDECIEILKSHVKAK